MPRAEDSKGSAVSTWRWLVGYLMLQKKVFVPSLLALFVTAGLALAFPWFLKDLIGDPMNAMRSGADTGAILAKVNHTIGWLLVALAVQAVIGFFRVIGFIRSGEMAMNALRRDLFGHLVKLPVPIFMDTRPGELSNRISADLAVLRDTLLNTVPQAARQSVVLVGGLVVIVVTSMKLTLVMLVSVPVVVAAVALFGRKVRSRSRDAQDALAEASTVLEETTQGIFNVKTFNNQDFEAGRYERALEKFLGVTMRGALARAGFVSFIIFVLFGTIAGVIWYGAREMAHGTILPKELVAFILFSIFVGASLGSLPEILSQFQATAGATQRLRELMDTRGEREDGREVGALRGDVKFEGVNFAYPSRAGSMILRDFSLHVPEAKRYAIVGPSGAGKSTLFSLLLGLYEPQSGEILVDDERLRDLNLGSFRSHVAIVPQEVMLFGGSIRENIAYGRQGATEEEIREAARLANVEEFVANLPEGYETLVGARGTKLSGGQRQRIAIARAILANPRILLLDEATSALDAESERLIHEALERLMVGRTCLVIAHRLSTVRDADQIVVMQGGQIVEQGRHEELVALRGAYHVLARTQLA